MPSNVPDQVLQQGLEGLDEGVALFGRDLRLLVFNRHYVSLFGLTPDDVHAGLTFEDLAQRHALRWKHNPAGAREYADRRMVEVRAGRVFADEWIRADGTILTFEDRPLAGGGVVTVCCDVTALKYAEAALNAEEERLQRVLEAVNDGIWDWDIQNNTTFWADQVYILLGHEPGTLVPALGTLFLLTHPEDRSALVRMHQEHLSCDTPYRLEVRLRKADDSYGWFLIRNRALRDADGRPVRMVGSIADIDRLKNAEQALKERVAFQRTLMETIPAPLFYKDVQGRFLGCNPAFETCLGQPRNRIIGRTLAEILPEGEREEEEAIEHQLLARPGCVSFESPFPHAGGVDRQYLFSLASFPDAEGAVGGLVGTMLDITERKQAEAALRASEERYALVMAAAGDALWDWDIRTDRIHRPQFKEFLDIDADGRDSTSRQWLSYIHPDDRDHYKSAMRAYLKRDISRHEVEYRIRDRSGNYRWLQDHGLALWDENGWAYRMVGLSRDITERKQTEEALRNSEERYALVMSAAGDSLWDWDISTDRVFRPQLRKFFDGCEDGGVGMGREWLERIHPDDTAAYQAAIRDHLQHKTESYESEYRVLGRDGKYHWLQDRGRALWDCDGRAYRMAGSTRDVTLRKEAEQQLRRTTALVSLLHDIAVAANDAETADQAMLTCLRLMCAFTGWPVGHICLVVRVPDDSGRGEGESAAAKSATKGRKAGKSSKDKAEQIRLVSSRLWHLEQGAEFTEFRQISDRLSLSVGEGLPGLALAEGRPVWFQDLVAQRFSRQREAALAGLRSGFAFPVVVGQSVVAVLEFFSARTVEPDQSLIAVLPQIGTQLGRVLERRREEEELRRAHDDLERRVKERTQDLELEIAERRAAESALRRREQQLRDIAEVSSDWFWEMGPDLRMTYFSSRFADVTGLDPADFIGKTRLEYVDPEQLRANPRKWRNHQERLQKHLPFRNLEMHITGRGGRVFHILVNGKPVFDEAGIFQGYRGTTTDITARKQTEDLLRKAHDELELRVSERTRDLELEIAERGRAEEALRRSEERLRLLLESTGEGIIGQDLDGVCTFCNPAAVRLLGLDSPAALVGRKISDLIFSRQADGTLVPAETCPLTCAGPAGVSASSDEEFFERADGVCFPVEYTSHPMRQGEVVVGSVITFTDITARKAAEDRLRKLSRAVEQSPAAIVITNTDGLIEYVNPKFTEVTGYEREEVIGQNSRFLKSGHTSAEQYAVLWQTIKAGREWRGELKNTKKDGTTFWEYVSISPIKSSSGEITHYLAVKEDMTVRKQYEEQLLRQANFDQLTGLPNRLLALDRLNQALARSRRENLQLALLFIDLDNFKTINDTFGHAAGDCLLRESAARLKECLREEDTVARFGGDEFMVILSGLKDAMHAELVSEKILAAFSLPFMLEGHEVFSSTSIGVTIAPMDGDDPHVLMRNADTAMYQAKVEGRATHRFFTDQLNERARVRIALDTRLRRALERDEFYVCYQPLIEVHSGRVAGAEALLRWRNAELGNVRPDQFIPLAEETGLIVPIGEWVMNTVANQIKTWCDAGVDVPYVAVNVSSRQFRTSALVKTVQKILEDNRISADRLELEITESLLIEDVPRAGGMLREFAAMGVKVCVDDFGTGYSSLGYLRRFPLHGLKIDRSFIRDVTTSNDAAALTEAIIAMAHRLNLKVVGEGVETIDQLRFLRSQGCDIAQGFYFSIPLPAIRFPEVVETLNSAQSTTRFWGTGS